MPLLDVTQEQLLLIRNAIDGNVALLVAHEKATDDPYVAAAIGVNIQDYIALRQDVVRAMKPAPWPDRKQQLDDLQSGDGLAMAPICLKHQQYNCAHCTAVHDGWGRLGAPSA